MSDPLVGAAPTSRSPGEPRLSRSRSCLRRSSRWSTSAAAGCRLLRLMRPGLNAKLWSNAIGHRSCLSVDVTPIGMLLGRSHVPCEVPGGDNSA